MFVTCLYLKTLTGRKCNRWNVRDLNKYTVRLEMNRLQKCSKSKNKCYKNNTQKWREFKEVRRFVVVVLLLLRRRPTTRGVCSTTAVLQPPYPLTSQKYTFPLPLAQLLFPTEGQTLFCGLSENVLDVFLVFGRALEVEVGVHLLTGLLALWSEQE